MKIIYIILHSPEYFKKIPPPRAARCAAALLHQEDRAAGERERGFFGAAVAAEVEAVAVRLRFGADGRCRVAGANGGGVLLVLRVALRRQAARLGARVDVEGECSSE